MPNLLITNNAKFKPFSYEELVKPLDYAEAMQNAYEESYGALGSQVAGIADSLSPDDKDSWAIVNNYNQMLQSATDSLMKNSFRDPNVRQSLIDLQKGYNNGMSKVANAVGTRNAQLKSIAEQKAKNPSMIFSPVGSVDDYLNGRAGNVVGLDLKDLRDRSEKLAKGISERMYRDGIENLGNGMFLVRNKQGYDNIETLAGIMSMPKRDEDGNIVYDENGNPQLAYPEVSAMYNQLYNKLYEDPNVLTYFSQMPNEKAADSAKQILDNAIQEGMLRGTMYKETTNYHNIPKANVTNVTVNTGNGEEPLMSNTGKSYSFNYKADMGYQNPIHEGENLSSVLNPIKLKKSGALDYELNVPLFGKDGTFRMRKTFMSDGLNQFEKQFRERHPNWENSPSLSQQHNVDKAYQEKKLRKAYDDGYEKVKKYSADLGITPEESGYIRVTKNQLSNYNKQLLSGRNVVDQSVRELNMTTDAKNKALNYAKIKNSKGDVNYDIYRFEGLNSNTNVVTLGKRLEDKDFKDKNGNIIKPIEFRMSDNAFFIKSERGPYIPAVEVWIDGISYIMPARYLSNEASFAISNAYIENMNNIGNTPIIYYDESGNEQQITGREAAEVHNIRTMYGRTAAQESVREIEGGKYSNTKQYKSIEEPEKKSK